MIGEPESSHSDERVWNAVFKGYYAGKICCDAMLQWVFAVPLSFLWGACFSCLAFCQIYCSTPCIKVFNLLFTCSSRIYYLVVHCCCDPVCEAYSLFFTKIFVNHVQADKGYVGTSIDELAEMYSYRGLMPKRKRSSLKEIDVEAGPGPRYVESPRPSAHGDGYDNATYERVGDTTPKVVTKEPKGKTNKGLAGKDDSNKD